MAEKTSEDQVLMALKQGEHRVYRSLDHGVIFAGLPFWWVMGLIFGGALGFFLVKSIFSSLVGWCWIAGIALTWSFLGYLQSKDQTFVPIWILKNLHGVKFFPEVTSYTRSRQRVQVLD